MERYTIVDPGTPRTPAEGTAPAPMPWPTEAAPVTEVPAPILANDDPPRVKVTPEPDKSSGRDTPPQTLQFPGEDGGKSLADMAQRDFDATLRLLAERAQYITEATGAAIALCEDDDMVCRASAGSSAPEMGATLQVDSGLTGESVHTRTILYCEDAETDPRVNRESCQALGIASVVVMPLLREQEVSGLFELFSDKPHAFTPRDIAALERLGEMVQVALDHAQAARSAPQALAPTAETQVRPTSSVAPTSKAASVAGAQKTLGTDSAKAAAGATSTASVPEPPVVTRSGAKEPANKTAVDVAPRQPAPLAPKITGKVPAQPAQPAPASSKVKAEAAIAAPDRDSELKASLFESPAGPAAGKSIAEAAVAPGVRSAEVSTIRKCAKCGFPISGGRTLCLDCEPKSAKPTGSGSTSQSANSVDSLASTSALQRTDKEGKAFWRNPYLIAALVITIMLAVAFWLWHSS